MLNKCQEWMDVVNNLTHSSLINKTHTEFISAMVPLFISEPSLKAAADQNEVERREILELV